MKTVVGFLLLFFNYGLLSAQDQIADNLKQSFNNYQSKTMQEKLFVHTDKTFYLAGETVWFKVYDMDASFHRPFSESRISYIEILNREGKSVAQVKISMKSGSGHGSLTIPGFVLSGDYIFRAYTSWMKNFSPDFYFEQSIRILNTQKGLAVISSQKRPVSIQFFPEGGHSVTGLPCKIAFKATDTTGGGQTCNGVIVNQRNDTITHFQSQHNGMGSFQLNPEKNISYYAILHLNDSLIKQKLPDSEDHGFVMNIHSEAAGKIEILISATAEYDNTPVYLFSQTRQLIKNVQVSQIKDGAANFQVDKKDLGDGISSLTLFDQLRQPVCERLVFKRPVERLFIGAKLDQAIYNTRNPITLDLSTQDAAGRPLSGNCSVSVFMIDSLQPLTEQHIVSWLFLSSDLRGKIESPEYYLDNTDTTSDEALDNLLLTQGWRRFKWGDITENKKPSFEFLPEIEGPVVNAKIINKKTGLPVSASVAYLSIPGADYAFSSATSNTQGIVHFGFKDVYKNNAIVVQPALIKDSGYRVDISSPWSDKFSSGSIYTKILSRGLANELLNRSISNQVENTFSIDRKRQYAKSNSDTTSFYGRPDKEYYMDDYVRFQTMEELMREYVEDVRVRKEGEKFTFKVRNRLFGTYFEEDPLILLDGIPISDATKVIVLDPEKIKKIELVKFNYYFGSSAFAGIVNIKSYNGELGATQIDPNALVVEFEGLQQQREFYSPAYPSAKEKESHIPDFRNVLYWAPQINTGDDGRARVTFYTSDLKGKFALVVEGISAGGRPGSSVTLVDVRDSK